jgi:hypothetical protein
MSANGYRSSSSQKPFGKALVYGATSTLLYALLYVYEGPILKWTTRGKWYFILPVAIAFVLSFFHGGFTGYFWEVLGVRAKTTEKK